MVLKKLLTLFGGAAAAKAEEKIMAGAASFYENKFTVPNLEEDVKGLLLKSHGEKVFYNDFDIYITGREIILKTIDMFRLKGTVVVQDRDQYVEEHYVAFLKEYPEYINDLSICMQIKDVFTVIYDAVYCKCMVINAPTDERILQADMHRIESQNAARFDQLAAKLDSVGNNVARISEAVISNSTKEDIGECSERVTAFMQKIEEVSINNDHSSKTAINAYTGLLADIARDLREEPSIHVNKLICSLQSHIALCYSNMGDTEAAFDNMEKIDADSREKSKLYCFVMAAIIINNGVTEKYSEADICIKKALALDENYHRAFLLNQYLNALTKSVSLNCIIEDLDGRFSGVLDKNDDKDLINDFHVYRALIYKEFSEYENAIREFEIVKENGYDQVIADYNIGTLYYNLSAIGLDKGKRVFCPKIDVEKMMKTISIFETWLLGEEETTIPDHLKPHMVAMYASSCALVGVSHKLKTIKKYINLPGLKYEEIRMIILGAEEELSDDIVAMLNEDDKTYFKIVAATKKSDLACAKKIIESLDDSIICAMEPALLTMLLQVYIVENDHETYWKYRRFLNSDDEPEMVTCMDAYAYEAQGDLCIAKNKIDIIAEQSEDYRMICNMLRFYARNSFDEEREKLLLRVWKLKEQKKIYIDDLDEFYVQSISFFVRIKSKKAEGIINLMEKEALSEETFWKIKMDYYHSINDVANLYECAKNMYRITGSYQDACNEIVCLQQLLRYDEAVNMALSLLDKLGEREKKEQLQIIWTLSDLYLLLGQNDESDQWAKKAHEITKENPYDLSHKKFLARSIRTGHFENLSDIANYGRVHPVVVNWIKEFKVSQENCVEEIKANIKEFGGGTEGIEKKEKTLVQLYKAGRLPNSVVLNIYDNDLGQFLVFASKNKLQIASGIKECMEREKKQVGKHIVVDAITLIMLKHYKCFEALSKIAAVHVTYTTVKELQMYYLTQNLLYTIEIMDWLSTAENVVFEADGYAVDTSLKEVFSNEIISCCNMAGTKNIPYLTIDPIVISLCIESSGDFPNGIIAISIPSFCRAVESEKDRKSAMVYNLLRECTFVSFSSEDILYQIRKEGYVVVPEMMKPFFICDTSCDMISFANVYLGVIFSLTEENVGAAESFANMVLQDALRIWKKGTHSRYCSERFEDEVSLRQAETVTRYCIYIVEEIKKIYKYMPVTIQNTIVELYKKMLSELGKDKMKQLLRVPEDI